MEGDYTPILTPSEGPLDGNQKSRYGRTTGPARRSTRGQWTAEEDEILRKAVHSFNGKNWKKIAEYFKDRTDVQCLHRWQKVLNPELVKGPWTKEEDDKIIQLVGEIGPKKWSTIASYLPGRIGKQCRERWHNHLNPAINKDAWTQEEELVLIRAHQIYGNRWAELTKFLPGRSDNGIKNHWHSSVKKKLESYMSNGLLDQYQTLPLAPYERSSMLPSTAMQRTIDENGCLSVFAENRQNSNMAGCSLSTRDYPNQVINMGDQFRPCENSQENEQAASVAFQTDQYFYPELEDLSVSFSDISYDINELSQYTDQNVATSSNHDIQDLSDISHEMRQNMSEVSIPYMKESKECTASVDVTTSVDVATYNNPANEIRSDTECCRVLFHDQESEEGLSVSKSLTQEPNEVDQADYQDPSFCASVSDNQISGSTKSPLQSCSSRSIATASGKETLRPAPLIISPDKHANESSGLICHPFAATPKRITNANGSFICIGRPSSSTCVDEETNNSIQQDQSYRVSDLKKLVPVNDFASLAEVKEHSLPEHEPNMTNEQHPEDMDASSLRFPSLDLPVFSSDLLQSKNDLLQDYSPLGIRKLLMSTVTCMSPLRLWESPTGKKTLVGKQSILKKRTRDLLTPLSEKRSDKKLEIDIAASLAKDFSRLDVMFDESCERESVSAKSTSVILGENHHQTFNEEDEESWRMKPSLHFSHSVPEETMKSLEKTEQTCMEEPAKGNDDSEPDVVHTESLSGVLAEQNTNKPELATPSKSVIKSEKAQGSTPRNHLQRTLIATSNKESLCLVINSPSRMRNTEGHLANKEIAHENFSIFCGTPFRRSLESPSAWKSPFYMNSFLSSPRYNTEMTIEDIGYIFSPGERNYNNAGGLMTDNNNNDEVSQAAAEALADIIGFTGSIIAGEDKMKQKEINKENDESPMTERRVLDFNDCLSPTKPTDSSQSSIAADSCSSSSYLLKGCR